MIALLRGDTVTYDSLGACFHAGRLRALSNVQIVLHMRGSLSMRLASPELSPSIFFQLVPVFSGVCLPMYYMNHPAQFATVLQPYFKN